MPFYEVIYETGAHSVVQGDDDEAVIGGLREQQRRALEGEDGGPAGHAAERVKRVLKYDEHPAEYGASMAMGAKEMMDELSSRMRALADNQGGQVSIPQAVQELILLGSPIMPISDDRHASIYKAPEVDELDASAWAVA